MAPVPPEEIAKLMRYVAKKSKNVKGPMNIRGLCRRFKEKTGTSATVNALCHRLDNYRDRIHEMDWFDSVTKVKMMIALNAPVHPGFLRELRKEADVRVNSLNRIIRYEQKKETNNRETLNESSGSSGEASATKKEDTYGEGIRIQTAPEVSEDYEIPISNRAGTSDHEEHDVPEDPPRVSEVDAKPENLFWNSGFEETVKREIDDEIIIIDDGEDVKEEDEDQDMIVVEQIPGILPENEANELPDEPSTSILHLLILLRGSLLPLESRHLNGLRRKIEEKIQKLGTGGDQQIPLKTLHLPFDMCLCLLMKHASWKSEEESTSLRRFMVSLQSATSHLIHPSMTPFHKKLGAHLDELDARDQKIPIKVVHNAMDSVLNFVDT